MLQEKSGEIAPERMKRMIQSDNAHVDVTSDGSKVQYCNEQYCIGTWKVRSMNQDKLKGVKR